VTVVTVETGEDAHRSCHQQRARVRRGQWELKMTASFTDKVRQAGLVLGFALSLSALSSTQSFAYSEEARQQCTGDAFKLCSSDIPNVSAVTACMMKHRTQLTPGCRSAMDKELASRGKKVAATN
jgi:hypothetical protein